MSDTSQKKIANLLLWISAAFLLLYVLFFLSDLIIILALSVLLAFIFSPFVFLLEQRGFSRLSSTLIAFAGLAIIIYLSLSVVIPKFSYQMNQLITRFEKFSLTDQLKTVQDWLAESLPFIDFTNLTTRLEEVISTQLVNSVESVSLLVSGIVSE